MLFIVPYVKDAFEMKNDEFKIKYGKEKPAKDSCSLIFHCASGVRSQRAVDIVKQIGYTWYVYSLERLLQFHNTFLKLSI